MSALQRIGAGQRRLLAAIVLTVALVTAAHAAVEAGLTGEWDWRIYATDAATGLLVILVAVFYLRRVARERRREVIEHMLLDVLSMPRNIEGTAIAALKELHNYRIADASVVALDGDGGVLRPLVARGVGEILSPLPDFPQLHVALVNPGVAVATADVFRRLRAHDNYPLPALPAPLTRPAQLGLWLNETRNDLQPPAVKLVPEIGVLIEEMAETPGCMLSRMSGSGATCFGLYGSAAAAHQAAHDLRENFSGYWVAATPLLGQ